MYSRRLQFTTTVVAVHIRWLSGAAIHPGGTAQTLLLLPVPLTFTHSPARRPRFNSFIARTRIGATN